MSDIGTARKVKWGIDATFITQLARQMLFEPNKGYDVAERTLLSILQHPDLTELERKRMAQDLLLGRAEFQNDDDGVTFVYVEDDNNNVFNLYQKLLNKVTPLEENITLLTNKYLDLFDGIRSIIQGDTSLHWVEFSDNKELLEDLMEKVLQSFTESKSTNIEQENIDFVKEAVDGMLANMETEDPDYGWLKPNGEFIDVPWGHHGKWATNFVQSDETLLTEFNDSEYGIRSAYVDFVVNVKKYILFHNPSQGIAIPQCPVIGKPTQKQLDFAMNYYKKRGQLGRFSLYFDPDGVITTFDPDEKRT